MTRKLFFLFLLMTLIIFTAAAENQFDLTIQGGTEITFTPSLTFAEGVPFQPAYRGDLEFVYKPDGLGIVAVHLNAGYSYVPTKDSGSIAIPDLQRVEAEGGLGVHFPMGDILHLRIFGGAGYYHGFFNGAHGGDFLASGGMMMTIDVMPALGISISPRYRLYGHSNPGLLHTLDISLGATWHIDS